MAARDNPADIAARSRAAEDDGLDRWVTSRHGNPFLFTEGWGLSADDGYPDLVALKARLRQEAKLEPNPYITLDYLATRRRDDPDDPDGTRKTRAYTTKGELAPAIARRQQQMAARKALFLAHLRAGHTITSAVQHLNITQQTYVNWRTSDLSFRADVENIRAGITPPTSSDGTFSSFRRYYFGYDSYTHHEQIIDAIEQTAVGEITLILLPPEAGKTSLLEDYISHQIALDPNYRILYVSEQGGGMGVSAKVLSTIKARCTDESYTDLNAQHPTHIAEYIVTYGPFHDDALDRDKPWNASFIKVAKASGQRDYTFQAVGWKSRIYGARTDLLVLDDVQSDGSLNETEQMLTRIRKTFITRMDRKRGKCIIIGQMLAPGCLYERMMQEEVVDRVVIIPALDERGESYCPQMWPAEDLAKRRQKVGEDVWWAAYMQAPRQATNATFTDEMIDQCKNVDVVARTRPSIDDGLRVGAALDPALGGGNALIIGAYNATRLRIIDVLIDYDLTRNEDIFARIRAATSYHFVDLIVERNSQQRGIARDDRLRDMARDHGFRIREHETGSQKWDFAFGVGAMAGSFLRKEIELPWGDDTSELALRPLIDELRSWRPSISPKLQRQDIVMAMWFLWLHWQREREALEMDMTQWTSRGTPWRPGDMSGRWGHEARVRSRSFGHR